MINLIPNEDKKKMIRDFYLRFTAVAFIMLGFCMLIATVSIMPAYFMSKVRKNLIEEKLQIQKDEQIPLLDQEAIKAIEGLKKELILVENSEKNKFFVSEKIIDKIISLKMSDIKIDQINYDNNKATGKKININGTAPSRERLLLFREALEKDGSFNKVDLPISNFVKGSNIKFSLILTFP